ncbi:hypothetical protein Syun_007260 [Stephania yunnanensis]|uniref:PI3K/PI4K catalytic domain-containing protein n=1 Tax=Stephania yunnanensis TaxID=152371 RepID=A0AAP0L1N7_9MAGN
MVPEKASWNTFGSNLCGGSLNPLDFKHKVTTNVEHVIERIKGIAPKMLRRSPNKILFAKSTGKIFQTDFHPAYDGNGMIEFNEPVPFQLTRNMQTFFSYFGVEGLIVLAMCSTAQAVVSPKVSPVI